ncbi:MAG: uroporphyrinogen-III synthase [Steroidobacteraceae bacterium]
MTLSPLSGRTIAVPEARELDIFAGLLTRRGATVLRCPLVAIRDAPDPAPVLAWLRRFAAGGCDDLILLTGEGLRRLIGCLEQHEGALREPFVSALGRVRKITRGPKPARALKELGLATDVAASPPTTEGIIQSLRGVDLSGHRVGLQLYGTAPNVPLVEFLQGASAEVSTVAPYVYSGAADDRDIEALLERMKSGAIDAIAFTSTSQVEVLFAGREASARKALGATLVAAVGPVVAGALADRGVATQVMPAESFSLKPLTAALEKALI